MNKNQVLLFRNRVMYHTFNSLCVFGLGCIGLMLITLNFGPGLLVLGTILGLCYQLFFSWYLEIKILSGQASKNLANTVLYLNALSFAPCISLMLVQLNYADVCIALGITALLCSASYYLSKKIPITQGQLTVLNYLCGYILASGLSYIVAFLLKNIAGVNILPLINMLFPQILISSIIIAFAVYFINYWLQVSNHLAERVYSLEELEMKSIFIAIQISTWVITMFREILHVMLHNKRRR